MEKPGKISEFMRGIFKPKNEITVNPKPENLEARLELLRNYLVVDVRSYQEKLQAAKEKDALHMPTTRAGRVRRALLGTEEESVKSRHGAEIKRKTDVIIAIDLDNKPKISQFLQEEIQRDMLMAGVGVFMNEGRSGDERFWLEKAKIDIHTLEAVNPQMANFFNQKLEGKI